MKKIIPCTKTHCKVSLVLVFLFTSIAVFAQNIGINQTGVTPNTAAILDLNTGNTFTSPNGMGLLIPNVALTGSADAVTIALPPNSLLVYVPTGSGLTPAGYYYNAGTPTTPSWMALGGSGSPVSADNGLSVGSFTAGDVELGGTIAAPSPLIGNSVISGSNFNLDFDLGTYSTTGTGSFLVTNGGVGTPLLSVTSNAPGVGININPAVSTLDDNGSFGTAVSAVITANTLLNNTNATVLANPSGGALTITLPAPGVANTRRRYTIIFDPSAATTNLVTITSATANTIISSGTLALTSFTLNGGSVTLQSNGTDWFILSGNVYDIPVAGSGLFFPLSNATYYTSSPMGAAFMTPEIMVALGYPPNAAKLITWLEYQTCIAENVGTLAAPNLTAINTYDGDNLALGSSGEAAFNWYSYVATNTCRLNSVNMYFVYNSATATVDVEVYKYPAASNNNVTTLTGGVAVASNSAISLATSGNMYNVVIPGNGVVINPGDILIVWVRLIGGTTGFQLYYTGAMQFQSFQ